MSWITEYLSSFDFSNGFMFSFVPGYIMVKVLLHFSDSKKGSSFGLKTSNLSSKKKS